MLRPSWLDFTDRSHQACHPERSEGSQPTNRNVAE